MPLLVGLLKSGGQLAGEVAAELTGAGAGVVTKPAAGW